MKVICKNRTFSLICLVFFILMVSPFAFGADPVVKVTSVSPNRGAVDQNTSITITGLNFVDPSQAGNSLQVTVGGNPVIDLTYKDSRTLTAKTPLGTLGDGETESAVDVVVTQSLNGGAPQSATLVNGFTYVLPGSSPTISEIYDQALFRQEGHVAANSGPLEGGNTIVIVGTDFRTEGETLPVVSFGHGEVWVQAQVKEVVSIAPGAPADYTLGLPAYVAGEKETAIIAVAPAGTSTGALDVRVTNPDLASYTSLNAWIYKICNLVITSVTPDYGPAIGGVEVVLSGANFDEDVTLGVEFVHKYEDGTTESTVVERNRFLKITNTQVHIDLPPSIQGITDVVVYNRFGSRTLTDGFVFTAPRSNPVIDSITPSQGGALGGDIIEISGEDFRNESMVYIGANQAEVLVATWDTLTVRTSAGAPGIFDVTVINPDGSAVTKRDGFTYISYPQVEDVSPSVVNTAGGTIVTISGDQFYKGAEVFFEKGGLETPSTEVKVVDVNTIYARVPEVVQTGFYDVIVRNTDYDPGSGLGEGILGEGILYEDPPAQSPDFQDIYPDRGPVTGGIRVVVTCLQAAPDAQIFVGLEEAQVNEYLGDGRFSITLPPNEEGNYFVTVTNPDGGTGVSDTAVFQYREATTEVNITAIAPNSGSTEGGTYVTIRGIDFRSGAEVYFGSAKATDVTVTLEDPVTKSYKISCYTPAGDIGYVDVAVINPDNSFGIAIVKNGFNYRSPDSDPVITSVTPGSGPIVGGTRITVSGSDFRAGLKLYVDGIEATNIVRVDDQTITAVAPAHAAGKTVVSVVNYDGGSFAFGDDGLEPGFTYAVPGSSPQITSVTPNFGPAEKTTMTTITGLDFRVNAKVYFGSVQSTQVEYVDYQTLRALAPEQGEGTVDVTVVNEDFGTGTLAKAFSYRSSKPNITKINPSIGNRAGGDIITILGEELVVEYEDGEITLAPQVFFQQGNLSAQGEVLEGSTSEALIVRTPAAPNGVIGAYNVRVVNFDEAEDTVKNGFKYMAPDSQPDITSVEPDMGTVQGGTPIKIYGSDFRDDPWVYIGGIEATGVQVIDENTIKAVTPANSAGVKDVTVVNYDGGSFTFEDGFTYSAPESEPVVNSIAPNKGPQTGGTEITITGRDFRDGVEVYIGGELCTDILLVNYKTITAVTPPGEEGTASVTVSNPDLGSFTLTKGFTYIHVEVPVILAVTPNEGVSDGGTEIVVAGENFTKGLTLTIGGAQATVVSVTENEIHAVTPAGTIGLQDVRVTNPDGGWVELEDGFKYIRKRSEPDTPGGLEATSEDKFTIKLEWESAEFATYFEIYVREKGEDNYRFVDQTKSDTCVYYVTGLQPDTTYYFKVRAVNELGLSGFTATDSAKTKSGSDNSPDKEEQDEVQVVLGQGSRTLTASSENALEDCGYTFDFLDPVSLKNPVSIVQVNADVALDIRQDVTINLQGCQFIVPPGVWNLPEINSLSSRESKEAVVRLIIVDAGQREAERAMANLPSGAKVISRVYSLQIEVISRGSSQFVELFPYPVTVTFQVPANMSKLKNIAVYSRNFSGTWTKASGSTVSYGTAKGYTYGPTTFLLAGF